MKLYVEPTTADGNVTLSVGYIKNILKKYPDDYVISINDDSDMCGLNFEGADHSSKEIIFTLNK